MPPMKQVDAMVSLLNPIRSKIIGVTAGNHEARVYRSDGLDMMRFVCRELCVEPKYNPEGVLIFLRFGTAAKQGRHSDISPKQWYTIYATHGSGGGRKEGAKIIRLAELAGIVDADIYVHSHTHLPIITKEAYFRVSSANCSTKLIDKLFVNTGATMSYGGYGQAQAYKPSSKATPMITLPAYRKEARATL